MSKAISVEPGSVYGLFTVLRDERRGSKSGQGRTLRGFVCRCRCGAERWVTTAALRSGRHRSCGCDRTSDLIGQTSGRLTAVRRADPDRRGRAQWWCECSCDGRHVVVAAFHFQRQHTKSCGCLVREALVSASTARGKYHRNEGTGPTFRAWSSMISSSRQHSSSPVAERWWSFSAFAADMGDRPIGTLLRRTDASAPFGPGNARWVPRCERRQAGVLNRQHATHRRSATERGWDPLPFSEWSAVVGQPCRYCDQRDLRHGLPIVGVDRVDNALGYVEGNCVPCCELCNRIKWARSVTEFASHVAKMHKTMQRRGLLDEP